jgi:hypothetical protein
LQRGDGHVMHERRDMYVFRRFCFCAVTMPVAVRQVIRGEFAKGERLGNFPFEVSNLMRSVGPKIRPADQNIRKRDEFNGQTG